MPTVPNLAHVDPAEKARAVAKLAREMAVIQPRYQQGESYRSELQSKALEEISAQLGDIWAALKHMDSSEYDAFGG